MCKGNYVCVKVCIVKWTEDAKQIEREENKDESFDFNCEYFKSMFYQKEREKQSQCKLKWSEASLQLKVFVLLAWLCLHRFPLMGRVPGDPGAGLSRRSRRAQTAANSHCFCLNYHALVSCSGRLTFSLTKRHPMMHYSPQKNPREMGSLTSNALPDVFSIPVTVWFLTDRRAGLERAAGQWFISEV